MVIHRHLRAFSLYLDLYYDTCKQKMIDTLKLTTTKANHIDKIEGWWNGRRMPQPKTSRPQIAAFFKGLADERGKKFKDEWLNLPLMALYDAAPELHSDIDLVRQPYSIARIFKHFAKRQPNFQKMIPHYCPRYYFIYRIHSTGPSFVRDFMHVDGHEDGDIFCKIYQYTTHSEEHYPDHCKGFDGNIIFNNKAVYVLFASFPYRISTGPEFMFMSFPPLDPRSKGYGSISGLKDSTDEPLSCPIYIEITPLKDADVKNPYSYVSEVSKLDLSNKEHERLQKIRRKLERIEKKSAPVIRLTPPRERL